VEDIRAFLSQEDALNDPTPFWVLVGAALAAIAERCRQLPLIDDRPGDKIVGYDDLLTAGSVVAARAAGKVRMEGKDYVMQDGDVVEFRFNV
jgi:hypothetical protein